ncbi:hypothetical protein IGI39_003981 [Enterococcus sp. AZ135]|uniref:hypothetical protein n=1 Tax=unclassified Enterococcus TaxID=2608891 RepID=UPI003F27320D
MATKTFTKEFTLTTKSAENLIGALASSKRVDIESNHKTKSIHDRSAINSLVKRMIKDK